MIIEILYVTPGEDVYFALTNDSLFLAILFWHIRMNFYQLGNSFVKYECHPAFASGNSSWNERVMEFYVFDLKVTENRWMRPQTKGERVYWQNEIY